MKRASYREAVAFIAWNDEPSERDVDAVEGYATVQLVADVFRVGSDRVARDVVREREREDI